MAPTMSWNPMKTLCCAHTQGSSHLQIREDPAKRRIGRFLTSQAATLGQKAGERNPSDSQSPISPVRSSAAVCLLTSCAIVWQRLPQPFDPKAYEAQEAPAEGVQARRPGGIHPGGCTYARGAALAGARCWRQPGDWDFLPCSYMLSCCPPQAHTRAANLCGHALGVDVRLNS